jgi:rhodanese-related sulfurtransferase
MIEFMLLWMVPMRKLLPLAFLVLAAPAFAQTPAAPAASGAENARAAFAYNFKTPKLNRAEVDALLANPDTVLFVDLRRPDEISRIGTLPVYLNVQIGELDKYLAFIPKDRKIVTVSNHAARAGKAGDQLSEKGFKVVGAIGSQTYQEEGGTHVHAIPVPVAAAAQPAQTAAAAPAQPAAQN